MASASRAGSGRLCSTQSRIKAAAWVPPSVMSKESRLPRCRSEALDETVMRPPRPGLAGGAPRSSRGGAGAGSSHAAARATIPRYDDMGTEGLLDGDAAAADERHRPTVDVPTPRDRHPLART